MKDSHKKNRYLIFVLLMLLIPTSGFFCSFSENFTKQIDPSEKWSKMALELLPPHAVFFGTEDINLFVTGYVLYSLKLRPDVTFIDLGADALTAPPYRADYWHLLSIEKRYQRAQRMILKFHEEGRSVFGWKVPLGIIPDGFKARSDGFLMHIVPKDVDVLPDRRSEATEFFNQIKLFPERKDTPMAVFKASVAWHLGVTYFDDANRALEADNDIEFNNSIRFLMELGPFSPSLYVMVADLLIHQGPSYYPEVQRLLKLSIETSRKRWLAEDGLAWYWLGYISLEEGRVSDCYAQTSEALRWFPEYAPTHLQMGFVYMNLGKNSEANREFNNAIKKDPSLKQYIPKEIL